MNITQKLIHERITANQGVTIHRWLWRMHKQQINMYRNKVEPNKTGLSINESYIGETIEQKIERVTLNQEPIKDGAPLVYTERKDGVRPEFNPRTDRFEVAIEATDKVAKTKKASRKKVLEEYQEKQKPKVENGETPANSATSKQPE